eukprot:CAMPEP_0170491312 /NCGR_PEP_ID=MMETSP0208-20121228/10765_1 /TAXON_ID=197538 /ORGANISM="Strombidium inclinatum, Strain S3" /LENGTH=52 /DNA_ID=CAMNT_0010766865 /DNA_START=27 /DNA_END=185 /DNA_ORIENTATION=-
MEDHAYYGNESDGDDYYGEDYTPSDSMSTQYEGGGNAAELQGAFRVDYQKAI